MITKRTKKLVVFTAAMPVFYLCGCVSCDYYEPYFGVLFWTMVYVAVICGRMPARNRVVCSLLMCWGLFFLAQWLNTHPTALHTECNAFVRPRLVYGYGLQLIISMAAAFLSYLGNKLVVEKSY